MVLIEHSFREWIEYSVPKLSAKDPDDTPNAHDLWQFWAELAWMFAGSPDSQVGQTTAFN